MSVFGPSGAGKSTLTRALAAACGEEHLTAINADFYSEDLGDGSLADLRTDFALLAAQLAQPVGTVCACPEYDFRAFRRIARESSWNRFTIRPVVLVDHMWPFPAADAYVQVLAPREVAVARVAARNPEVAEWPPLLAAHWEQIAHPPSAGLAPSYADRLILDGMRPAAENVDRVREFLGGRVPPASKPTDPPANSGVRRHA